MLSYFKIKRKQTATNVDNTHKRIKTENKLETWLNINEIFITKTVESSKANNKTHRLK